MIVEEIKATVLTATKGMEIYKISEPEVYGNRVTLAPGDSPDNWAERPETIIEATDPPTGGEVSDPTLETTNL